MKPQAPKTPTHFIGVKTYAYDSNSNSESLIMPGAWCLAMEPVWHVPSVGVLHQQELVLSSSNPQCPTLRFYLPCAWVYYMSIYCPYISYLGKIYSRGFYVYHNSWHFDWHINDVQCQYSMIREVRVKRQCTKNHQGYHWFSQFHVEVRDVALLPHKHHEGWGWRWYDSRWKQLALPRNSRSGNTDFCFWSAFLVRRLPLV